MAASITVGMEDGLDSIKADTSQTLMRNARHQRLSAHYIQQALMSQVGFVGYIEFVVLNFVTAPSRCQKTRKTPHRTIAVRD
ncbi:hypothetical protein [Pseudomonas syringae]|uniref:hypothetical protein n=1 Tax=Pseudomonas syringae TaxID=317 RepID=UPI0015E8C35A|nr:hypothetical protein [Pseudomonas syringae]